MVPVRPALQEGPLLHFVCSMVAGLACATTTAPVDIVKVSLCTPVLQNWAVQLRFAPLPSALDAARAVHGCA